MDSMLARRGALQRVQLFLPCTDASRALAQLHRVANVDSGSLRTDEAGQWTSLDVQISAVALSKFLKKFENTHVVANLPTSQERRFLESGHSTSPEIDGNRSLLR
eukprot:GHVT01001973.1.p3 GENE.GHVT01001973.1~~GHVT01001973.1.p3  ORF type:complete len:105 (+),score=16.93 GHVT01001973.1:315-629(+)